MLFPVEQPDGSVLYSLGRGVPISEKIQQGRGDRSYGALVDSCLLALLFFLKKPTPVSLGVPVASRMIGKIPRRRRHRRARGGITLIR